MLACVTKKTPKERLGPDQGPYNDPRDVRLRTELRRYIDTRNATQKDVAEELKCTPAFLSYLLSGQRRAGADLLVALAEKTGRTTDDLLGLSSPRWRDLPGWDRLVTEGRARYPGVSRLAWEYVGNLYGQQPPSMDASAIAVIAMTWDAHATPEQRADLDDDVVDAEMDAQDAKVTSLTKARTTQSVRRVRTKTR